MAFVSKSFATDPSARPQLRGIVGWWFGYELALLTRSVRGGGAMTPRLAFAELSGGLRGLAGGYRRSQRRIGEIRREHA